MKLTVATAVLALAIWTPAAAHGGWLVLGIAALTLVGILLFGLWGDLAVGALVFVVCALIGTGARIVSRTRTVAAGRAARLVGRKTDHATAAPSPTP
jgi:hypothetical protein